MSDLVLIDSCMWIEALRRDGKVEVKLAIKNLLYEYLTLLCGPVELEVLGGARKNERQKIQSQFDILPYRPSDHKIWRKATQTSWQLRDAGLNVPWNDCIIATIALEHNYRVYSQDKHFKQIAPILGIRPLRTRLHGAIQPELTVQAC